MNPIISNSISGGFYPEIFGFGSHKDFLKILTFFLYNMVEIVFTNMLSPFVDQCTFTTQSQPAASLTRLSYTIRVVVFFGVGVTTSSWFPKRFNIYQNLFIGFNEFFYTRNGFYYM